MSLCNYDKRIVMLSNKLKYTMIDQLQFVNLPDLAHMQTR